jgi:exodeoxyribonuclease V beta subunit
VVADYKTNRLTRAGARQYADDYGPSGLVDAMVEHHYPLQALLYGVALHRYLRWKLRGHEGTTDVTGAAYLFVRGMTGPDVSVTDGRPHGVFTWEFVPGLLESLSRLLAGEPAPGGTS